MVAMEALGRLLDISVGIAPLDIGTARTGKRISLRQAQGVLIVAHKGIGTAADDPTWTLQEHTASSSGTSQNLAIINHYYLKSATTPGLLGSETWTRFNQTAAATVVDPGAAGTSAESEQILAIEVAATALSDGFRYVSLNIADVGSNAQAASVLYYLYDLATARKPANLPAPLS